MTYKIIGKYFPQKFGHDGKSSLNKQIVSEEFNQLRDNIDPKMLPEDVAEGFIKIAVEKQTTIKITGMNKQKVGMTASQIKSFRPPEPYKGKGIREKGQYILKKEGKKK